MSSDDTSTSSTFACRDDDDAASALPVSIERADASQQRRSPSSGGGDRSLPRDEAYWYRRHRNNEAARKSREKRRKQDDLVRQRLEEVLSENRVLRHQLEALQRLLVQIVTAGSCPSGLRTRLFGGLTSAAVAPAAAAPPTTGGDDHPVGARPYSEKPTDVVVDDLYSSYGVKDEERDEGDEEDAEYVDEETAGEMLVGTVRQWTDNGGVDAPLNLSRARAERAFGGDRHS